MGDRAAPSTSCALVWTAPQGYEDQAEGYASVSPTPGVPSLCTEPLRVHGGHGAWSHANWGWLGDRDFGRELDRATPTVLGALEGLLRGSLWGHVRVGMHHPVGSAYTVRASAATSHCQAVSDGTGSVQPRAGPPQTTGHPPMELRPTSSPPSGPTAAA